MKKLLLLILIVLLVALSGYIVIEGFTVGSIEILSYMGLQNRNKNLDETIQQSSKLAEKDFRQVVSQVTESTKKLEQTKKEYEEMTSSSSGDIQSAGQIEKYEVEALWVKLGNYATSEGAILKMDIVRGNTNETYNLKFTVTGSYISITDFISDIENDSTLGFKIEEFSMAPGIQDSNLKGMFTCKEVAIKNVSNVNNSYSGGLPNNNTTAGNATNTMGNNTMNNTNNAMTTNGTANNTNSTTTTNNTNVAR